MHLKHEKSSFETLMLEDALASLERMPQLPTLENVICILQKCRKKKKLAYAKGLHAYMCKSGLEAHAFLGNYLVSVLVDCGSMGDAQQVFNRLLDRNEYSWTSLITGYIEFGESQLALNLYQKMQEDSVHPSKYTFVALLKACARLRDAERGQEIHAEIASKGLKRDPFVGSTLVDLYAKCGMLEKAREEFGKLPVRDVVSWNILIAGYVDYGLGAEALSCFEQMQVEGVSPDAFTFACTLKACGSIGAIQKGCQIHTEISRQTLERDPFVGNTLVHMYAKCGLLAKAKYVFDLLPVRDVVSWNILIAGYVECGLGEEALDCFQQMQLEGVSPTVVTYVCSLKACSSTGTIDKGQQIHAEVARKELERAPFVGSTLVDMYAKGGLLAKAREVFEKMPVRSVVSWNILIAAYAQLGEVQIVFHMFQRMIGEGIKPDRVTFLSAFTVCSHAGLVERGLKFFEAMSKDCGIIPTIDHYTCMVDLVGRAGQLGEAGAMVEKMPFQPNLVVWYTLLGACRNLGNVELGRQAFEHAVRLDELYAAAYVLMSNICSQAGR